MILCIIDISRYAQYIKRRYQQPLPDDDGLLTCTLRNGYVELTVVSSESLTHETDMIAETNFMTCGLRKELLTSTLTLIDILKPSKSGARVRCVLIEGAPGVGKSTLAWELCHKWEDLDNVKQYKLVVLVSLREAQEATCLKDILPQYEDMDDVVTGIGDGKGILLILDGFDELPREKRQSGSIFIDIIKGVELPNATVIVTSRPSVSADLMRLCKHNIDRHLKILGFTGNQIKKFVESEFSDSENRAAFLQYINNNPIIKSMMYLPLYAVIVAGVFASTNSLQLKTMIQLYDAFTRSLIRRHLVHNKLVADDYVMPQSLQCKDDINKLPSVVCDQFFKLVEVAYNGLKTEKYLFTDLGNDFDHLGMMKKVQSLEMSTGPTFAFSYLHLTFQEYLAALHILYMPADLSDEVPASFGKREVVRFLAGLCCAHDNDNVHLVVDNLFQKIEDQRNLQLARCVYECNAIVQKIPVVHKLLFDSGTFSVSGKMPFDYYLIGHCVCHIGGQWSITVHSREEADQLVKGIESKQEKTCTSYLDRSRQTIKGTIEGLQLLTGPFGILLPILTIYTNLCCLKLYFITFNASDVDILQEYISHQVIKKIQIGSCRNIDIKLLTTLFDPSSLDTVHLSGTLSTSTDSDFISFATQELLSRNKNLKKLLIDDAIIGPQRLVEVVNSNDTLKELTLFVTEIDSRKYSHSFTGKSCNSTNSIERSARVHKTPMSLLEEAAQKKQIKLELIDPHTYDTLKGLIRTRSRTSHPCT